MTTRRMRRITLRATRASRFGAATSDATCVGNFRSVRERPFLSFKRRARNLSNDACADMWWIALALFLICVAEVRWRKSIKYLGESTDRASEQRGQLRNPDNASWFTIFSVCTSRVRVLPVFLSFARPHISDYILYGKSLKSSLPMAPSGSRWGYHRLESSSEFFSFCILLC
jgi:hypothetical protein